ncbi:MAG: TolC family protein [Planctomycetota bacterium]
MTNVIPGLSKDGKTVELDVSNIIQLVFSRSPRVTASREAMVSAQHGLDEFRRNLSRFEPFIEARGDVSEFPNREGAFGHGAEAVIGVQKETFEGAVLRTEAGGAFSRFEFGDFDTARRIEDGNGALVRARLEAPFFGSRKRQNRVIQQAFQESTARKARLDYLDDYGDYVDDAISYYNLAVYYRALMNAYEDYIADLNTLLRDERLRAADRPRVETVRASAESTYRSYRTEHEEAIALLLAETGLGGGTEYALKIDEYKLSPFAKAAENPSEFDELLERARENDPTFRVLNDAIRDTELQRQQAISGKYDVTTFLEGTMFPLGSESFDDRLDGWTLGGGVSFRLNDARVLDRTRLKAESEIRQFRARIRSSELQMRRRIRIETRGLLDNHRNREELIRNREQNGTVYEQRRGEYFRGEVNVDQLLSARSQLLSSATSVEANHYNTRSRVRRIMGATGEFYDRVGLGMTQRANSKGSNVTGSNGT